MSVDADKQKRNLRHALASWIPSWLANRPGLRTAYTILYVFALLGDFLVDAMTQGVFAAWPGKGTPTALGLIGASRGFVRGVGESDDSYAERLRGFLDTWPQSGQDELLGRLFQIYLGGTPRLVIRVLDRRGQFVTINADGTATRATDPTWDWDSGQFPERQMSADDPWWSDVWVIVYTGGRWAPTADDLSDPAWTAAWGTTDTGVGLAIPQAIPNDLKAILGAFKGAHNWVQAVIFTDDDSLFVPGSLGGTYPDGRWATWSLATISSIQTPHRSFESPGGTIRYMVPMGGG